MTPAIRPCCGGGTDKRQRGYRAMGYRVEAQREFGEISQICVLTSVCR